MRCLPRGIASCACVAALVASACAPAADEALVGRTLPPYPDGLDELQGTCLPASAAPADVCSHSVAVLGRRSEGGADRLSSVVALRRVGYDGQMPQWRVTDAAPYPGADAAHALQVGTCRLDGVETARLAALVRHAPGRVWSDDVTWARRLDLASGHFEVVEPARVSCMNEAAEP